MTENEVDSKRKSFDDLLKEGYIVSVRKIRHQNLRRFMNDVNQRLSKYRFDNKSDLDAFINGIIIDYRDEICKPELYYSISRTLKNVDAKLYKKKTATDEDVVG